MRARPYLLIALLAALVLSASCGKDEEKPKANAIKVDGVEQEIDMAMYSMMYFPQLETSKGFFRLSTAASRQAFDPEKDFEMYVKLDARHMNIRGARPQDIERLELKIKDKFLSTDYGLLITAGSIIIYLGSDNKAEVKIKLSVKYKENPEENDNYTFRNIECYYNGSMELIDVGYII